MSGDRLIRPVTIRDSRDSDVPHIAPLYREHVLTGTASWEVDPPDDAEFARRRAAVITAGYPYLVACLDGTDMPVGYAYASTYRPRPGYRFTVEDSIYVAPAAQGSGIGKRLLEALIARCTAQGYRQMIAVIGDSDNHASIGLHRACGFAHVATFRDIGYKFDRWLDSVQMQRAL